MDWRLPAGLGSLLVALALLYTVLFTDEIAFGWGGYLTLLAALGLMAFGGKSLYDWRS